MKLAVVQHRLRDSADEDARALVAALRLAAAADAEIVVLPEVLALHEDADARARFDADVAGISGTRLMPYGGVGTDGAAFIAQDVVGDLGAVAVLVGDAVLDADRWAEALSAGCTALVICPRSESELQAEAVLELALAFSDSLAGLVLIAECDGAAPGEAGHGGSAIISVGEVVAEAMSGDEVLLADISLPVAQPEPREALPELPTLLAQRVAHHHGSKLAVDYLADLSDGAGPA